jgi:hypothetical protein
MNTPGATRWKPGKWVGVSGRHAAHPAARFRATAADLRAFAHHCVVAKPLAVIRTRFADIGAAPAHPDMKLRTADHESRTRPADIGAIDQQPDMIRFGVLPTPLETMMDGRQADALAVLTVDHACFDLGTEIVMRHDSTPIPAIPVVVRYGRFESGAS